MMNQSKTSKAGVWKVATFLPLLALLLMAFGRTGENESPKKQVNADIKKEAILNVQDTSARSNEKIYSTVEIMPQYPGGNNALNKFLVNNIKYPNEASAKNIQGKVLVNFIINKEGKIVDPKVVRSIDPLLDAEALRVVKLMPHWIPGKDKGKTVSVSNTIPINFVLYAGPSDNKNKKLSPPPPNKDKHEIRLNNDGTLNYNLDTLNISFDVLENKIKSELQNNPKLQYNILIEEGKTDDRLNKTRDILKANGNPKVSYFSLHVDKGHDGKQYWSKKYTKPLDIK